MPQAVTTGTIVQTLMNVNVTVQAEVPFALRAHNGRPGFVS